MATNVASTNAIILEVNEVVNIGYGIYTNGRDYIFDVDGSVIVVGSTKRSKELTYSVYSRRYDCPMGYPQWASLDDEESSCTGGKVAETCSYESLQKSILGLFRSCILAPVTGHCGLFTVTLLPFPTSLTGIELHAYPLTVQRYDCQFSLMAEFAYYTSATQQSLHRKLQHVNFFIEVGTSVGHEPSPTVDSHLSLPCHAKGWEDHYFPWRKGNGDTDDPLLQIGSQCIYITLHNTILFTMGPLLFAYPFDNTVSGGSPVLIQDQGCCFVSSSDSRSGVSATCRYLLTTGAFNVSPHRTVSALATVAYRFPYTLENFVNDNMHKALHERASASVNNCKIDKRYEESRCHTEGLNTVYRLPDTLHEDLLDVPCIQEATAQANQFLRTSWKNKSTE